MTFSWLNSWCSYTGGAVCYSGDAADVVPVYIARVLLYLVKRWTHIFFYFLNLTCFNMFVIGYSASNSNTVDVKEKSNYRYFQGNENLTFPLLWWLFPYAEIDCILFSYRLPRTIWRPWHCYVPIRSSNLLGINLSYLCWSASIAWKFYCSKATDFDNKTSYRFMIYAQWCGFLNVIVKIVFWGRPMCKITGLSAPSVRFISLSSNIQEPEDWKQFAMSISAWLHQIDSTFIA
jgi:hypothetical protein